MQNYHKQGFYSVLTGFIR